MVIEPKVRGFICTTAHPTGCAKHVTNQIEYIKQQKSLSTGPKNVLVIGASTGYGLASRITAAFGSNAKTIGVFFEKPASGKRTASAGWYNSAAFEIEAEKAGLYAKSINGDAFSHDIKEQVIELVKSDWPEKIDCIIYSLASPRRQDPDSDALYQSVLKPISETYENKTVDIFSGEVSNVQIEPASQEEVEQTVKVMGGEDWALWIRALADADVLAEGVTTLAYSYIGPELTYPIYRHGTIGKAKEHLETTARTLNDTLKAHCDGKALISVNKGLVTQASSAIPVVPLYISILYKVMKEANNHEGTIEQMYRLFDRLYQQPHLILDSEQRIRLDDWELEDAIQEKVNQNWHELTSENLEALSDMNGYREAFYQLFGFKLEGVDYQDDVEANVTIPSIA